MPKKPEKRKPSTGPTDSAPVTNDARFASVHSDPRFAMPRRKDAKIAIDKRFTRMLKDDDFAQKASVDRYGRKLAKDAGKEEIKRYYRLADDSDDSGAEGSKDKDDEEEEEEEEEDQGKPRYDPARGEGVISSDDDDSSDEEEEEDDEVDAAVEDQIARQAMQREEIPTGDVTARLAAVNLDWDHVAAVDLMAAFSSFAPSGGRVLRVTVYPSEFGRERMERENMEGPPSEIFRPKGEKEEEEEEEGIDPDEEVTVKTLVKEDKGQEFDSAKLRNYQLERLRYYYAVVECDKPGTAHHIYEQCDGAEYEATANFFDLRFIPDDTSFEDDTPRDTCTEAPANYKPNDFVTDALQHSKVKLTWDADDTARQTAAKRAFSQKEVEEMDVKAYLASDSDSDAEDDAAAAAAAKEKYRALLSGTLGAFGGKGKGKKKEDEQPTGDMEITFTSGLSGKDKGAKVIEDDDDDGDAETAETTIEKYARKEKERKQRRKEKSKLLREGGAAAAADDDDEEAEAPAAAAAAVDLGFDDPFFAADDAVAANPKKEKKAKAKAQRAAEAAEAATKRVELEALMADADRDGLNHFDMKQVVKAEKEGGRKGKKGKGKKRSRQAEEALEEGAQSGFEIDVADERFAAVYEKNEFAIDPTNPRFVKTKAMEKLLGERQRRGKMGAGAGGEEEEEEQQRRRKKKVKVGGAEGGAKSDEVKRLVQSLKTKSGRVRG